jgi:hypothetical protein
MKAETLVCLSNILPHGMSADERLDHVTKILMMAVIALRQTEGDKFTTGFLTAALCDIAEGNPPPVILDGQLVMMSEPGTTRH